MTAPKLLSTKGVEALGLGNRHRRTHSLQTARPNADFILVQRLHGKQMPSPPSSSSARHEILKASRGPLCRLSPCSEARMAEPTETLSSQNSSCSLFYKSGALLRILLGGGGEKRIPLLRRGGKVGKSGKNWKAK